MSQVTRKDDLNTSVKYTVNQKANTCRACDESLFIVRSSGEVATQMSERHLNLLLAFIKVIMSLIM